MLICVAPYSSLMAFKMAMMLSMSALSFLVTTACAGLNPKLQTLCCPMSDKEMVKMLLHYVPTFISVTEVKGLGRGPIPPVGNILHDYFHQKNE